MKKATRTYSTKQEKQIAKKLNGDCVPNSGAIMFGAGDVRTTAFDGDWLIEAKTKTSPSKSFTIKKEWLEKNEREAFATCCAHSALVFSFGELHNDRQWYVLSEEEFLRLLRLNKSEDIDI